MRDTTEGRVRRIRLLIKFVWISTGKNEPSAISVISFFHVRFTLFVRQYRLWRKCPVWFLPPVRCPAVYACGMPQGAVLSASRSVPHVPHRRRAAASPGTGPRPPQSAALTTPGIIRDVHVVHCYVPSAGLPVQRKRNRAASQYRYMS